MKPLETVAIKKSFGNKEILKGIDFSLTNGEICGFIGRNGAGKSTFINIITGIMRTTSGTIKLFGNDTHIEHKKLGVLPDYSTFYNDMSGMQHIKYFAKINGVNPSKNLINEYALKLGIEKDLNKKVKTYSFGMKKKLGVIQAVIHDPDLIFLDEPTSGVDIESALKIHSLLNELKAKGKTILVTSHNLDEIEKICDRIAILKEGQLVHFGTMDQIRSHHRSTYDVNIQHSEISEDKIRSLQVDFNKISSNFSINSKKTKLEVTSDDEIAHFVKVLVRNDVNVFRLNVSEPTLEEMFLS